MHMVHLHQVHGGMVPVHHVHAPMGTHGNPWGPMGTHGFLQAAWRPILFFVGRSRGLPENPWGGKSMGWEILGKSMDKSRIFGNSDFDKKSRFENKLVGLFFGFLSFVDEVPIQWH